MNNIRSSWTINNSSPCLARLVCLAKDTKQDQNVESFHSYYISSFIDSKKLAYFRVLVLVWMAGALPRGETALSEY